MSIPPLEPTEEAGQIPSTVGILPENIEAPEAEPYLISFKHYNEKECELNDAGAMDVYSLSALKALRDMGVQVPSESGDATKSFGVMTIRVHDSNEYAKLFKGIDDPEVDMREVKLEGKRVVPDHHKGAGRTKKETVSAGRIFFYPIERTIYIVAMRANHYETEKR